MLNNTNINRKYYTPGALYKVIIKSSLGLGFDLQNNKSLYLTAGKIILFLCEMQSEEVYDKKTHYTELPILCFLYDNQKIYRPLEKNLCLFESSFLEEMII